MVLYASEFDQSKYLNGTSLGEIGSEKRVKIKIVTKETNVGKKQETKACVWFTNIDKGLLLNKTNLRTLQGAFGDNMENWPDKIVVLFSILVSVEGKMEPGLRVKIPPPKDNSYTAPAPKPTPTKKPIEDEDDDFDDDVSDIK